MLMFYNSVYTLHDSRENPKPFKKIFLIGTYDINKVEESKNLKYLITIDFSNPIFAKYYGLLESELERTILNGIFIGQNAAKA
jgi:hypothetical protein